MEGQGEYGSSITMNDDGTRIAVGVELFIGSQGFVDVWDYDGSDWHTLGGGLDGLHAAGRPAG